MKYWLSVLAFVCPVLLFSQANTVSLFTRPVVFYEGRIDKKVSGCANIYAGYERNIKQWKNRSNITVGAYGGLLFAPQVFRSSSSESIYTNEE